MKPGTQLSAAERDQWRRSYLPKASREAEALVYLDGQVTAWVVPAPNPHIGGQAERVLVLIFIAKQRKPVLHGYAGNAEQAAKAIKRQVESSQRWLAHQAEQKAAKAAKRAKPHGLKVGQVLVTSWGYDQTNVDFYEIVELVGANSARIAKIRGMECEGSPEAAYGDRGKTIPSDSPERRVGQPFLVRIGADGCKADGHYARPWDGAPRYWSSYA